MNKLSVYLYNNIFEVILDPVDSKGLHEIMYQRKLKIQKGFKDSIQIQFKNSDQKPLSLTTSSNFWFDMIDVSGRQLVLTKPLNILDDSTTHTVSLDQPATSPVLYFTDTTSISVGQSVHGFGILANTIITAVSTNTVTLNKPTNYAITSASTVTISSLNKRGIATIDFTPSDTINLLSGNYKFIVKSANNDGTFTPAYSNTYYGISGDIELVEDGFPVGFPVQEIKLDQLEAGVQYNNDPNNMGHVFVSDWLRPFPNAMTTSTPQTVTISMANFKGTITIQGTLDNILSPSGQANAQAFDITTSTISTPTQGNIQLSWNVPVTGVRFVIMPSRNTMGVNYYPTGYPIGSNINKYPNGYIDKIQYFS